jgi:Flp pilus assembly pilin Flp
MTPLRQQRGATAVEFALVAAFFLMLLFGIMEMGRVFFYFNGAAEATRLGARLAVVCDKTSAQQDVIRGHMHDFVSILPADAAHIAFDYSPSGCTPGTCQYVTVSIIAGATTFQTFIPFLPVTLSVPPFATTLPTESLDSTSNPVCT